MLSIKSAIGSPDVKYSGVSFLDCKSFGHRKDCASAEEMIQYFSDPSFTIGVAYFHAQLNMKD